MRRVRLKKLVRRLRRRPLKPCQKSGQPKVNRLPPKKRTLPFRRKDGLPKVIAGVKPPEKRPMPVGRNRRQGKVKLRRVRTLLPDRRTYNQLTRQRQLQRPRLPWRRPPVNHFRQNGPQPVQPALKLQVLKSQNANYQLKPNKKKRRACTPVRLLPFSVLPPKLT